MCCRNRTFPRRSSVHSTTALSISSIIDIKSTNRIYIRISFVQLAVDDISFLSKGGRRPTLTIIGDGTISHRREKRIVEFAYARYRRSYYGSYRIISSRDGGARVCLTRFETEQWPTCPPRRTRSMPTSTRANKFGQRENTTATTSTTAYSNK